MSFGPLHDLVDIESLAFNTIFCLIIGWPVAMALLAIGAVVLGKRVQQRSRLATTVIVLGGIAVGMAVTPALFTWASPSGDHDPSMLYAGAVAGLLCSACFCFIARGATPPSRA